MLHINAFSLNKNFDDLEYLLKCTNKLELLEIPPNYVTHSYESQELRC